MSKGFEITMQKGGALDTGSVYLDSLTQEQLLVLATQPATREMRRKIARRLKSKKPLVPKEQRLRVKHST